MHKLIIIYTNQANLLVTQKEQALGDLYQHKKDGRISELVEKIKQKK